MRASRGLSFLLGIWVFGLAAALGQTVRERARVDVVTVRFSARDGSGRNVTDLRPKDLALAVDGQATPIDTLDLVSGVVVTAESPVPRGGPARAVAPTPRVQPLPSQTAFFLDESETRIPDRTKVYQEISTFLGKKISEDELMVAQYTGGELRIVCPWTRDTGAARESLATLAANPGFERVSGSDGMSHFEREAILRITSVRSGLQRALLETIAAFPRGQGTRRIVFVTSGAVLGRPAELAEAFRSPHVEILASNATCSSVRCLRRVEADRTAFAMWTRVVSPGTKDLTADDVVVAALEHDVAIVPINTNPLAGGQDLGLDRRYAAPQPTISDNMTAIQMLWETAEQTGAEAILVPGKAASRLNEIGGRSTYELTFRDPFSADHHLHSISVLCKRSGVRIEYRRGYRIQPEDERRLDTVVAGLVRTREEGPEEAGVLLTLSPVLGDARLTRLRLTFDAPAEKELGDERTFDVIGVGQRDDGARTEPVRWTAVGERVGEDSAKFTAASDLKVPYGRYTWSFAVTDVETGLTSYALVRPPSSR